MIREEIVSKRYADAFLSYAKDHIGIQKALGDFQDVKRVIREHPEVEELLNTKRLTDSEKFELVDVVFTNGFSIETIYFIKLLIKKNRINLLLDIAEYARIHYAHGIETDVLVKTSYPLETETLQRIKTSLENKINKKIHLYVELDANLIGGAYAKIGNLIIDGSVRKHLSDIKEKLYSMKVV